MAELQPPRITTANTWQQESVITQSSLDIQSNKVTVVSSRVVPVPTVADEQTFRRLADRWLADTAFDSDPIEKFLHPLHLKIIGMGERVLPLLLREVEKMSGHWFVAL